MQQSRKEKLLEALKEIPDYRVDTGKIEYPLHEVLFMSLFALIKGNTTFKDIHAWVTYNKESDILKALFAKEKITVPSRSTLHALLINTDNNALEQIFRDYFWEYITQRSTAIDGKWLRGSDVNGQYTQASHKAMLNILDKEVGIVFAHKFLDKHKKSEISALKDVLDDASFSHDKQVFSFDALMTQFELLNTMDTLGNRYVAKLKSNQEKLKEKAIETIEMHDTPIDSFESSDADLGEDKQYITRKVEVFQSQSTDVVMFHPAFKNIQSLIRITKTLQDSKTGHISVAHQYLMANFKTNAKEFHTIIKEHWRVETYHYHLDMLLDEDDHIAYKEPFSMSILRSFAVNLYQLFFNANKDKKVFPTGKTTMAEIKRTCKHDDVFASELFEQEPAVAVED